MPVVLNYVPIAGESQLGPTMAVSFGRFLHPSVPRTREESELQSAFRVQPAEESVFAEGTVHHASVHVVNAGLENLILRELYGTPYFLALHQFLENFGTDGILLISQDGNSERGRGSETVEQRMRCARVTLFGIKLRGAAWKYSRHCGEAQSHFRHCRFCGKQVLVRYHHRFLLHLLGLAKPPHCTMPEIERLQLLEASSFARSAYAKRGQAVQSRTALRFPPSHPPISVHSPSSSPSTPPFSAIRAGGNAAALSQPGRRDGARGKRQRTDRGIVVRPFVLDTEGVQRLMKAIVKVVVLRVRPFAHFEKLAGKFTSPEREMLALLNPDIDTGRSNL